MSTHTPRKFEVPSALVAAGYGPTADLDLLDREVEFEGEFGEWAEKVLLIENTKILTDVCGDMKLLPRGILSSIQLEDESVLVSGLVDSDGRVWDRHLNSWSVPTDSIDIEEQTIVLDDDEVAFVARAFREGADEVWFRPYMPKAFVSAIIAAPPPPADRTGKKAKQPDPEPKNQEIPVGSAIIAVVDPIDEDAVLEMLAITPGPRVLRRHDGNWFEDPEWVPVLTSVRPPKIVKLDEAQIASVTSQVDRSTDEQDWEPFESGDREQYQIFTASAYLNDLLLESQQTALDALIAVAGRKLTPKDAASTERLKRYWTVGEGAAKIRWGTPGSWRRCYRHLVKYVGPRIAPGLCTNLAKRLGGHGVATHVTSSVESIVAANPQGVNQYDKGMSFEEATGGVKRDERGRFTFEGRSRSGRDLSRGTYDRSQRARRRKESLARFRAEREAKKNKKSDAEAKKREREARKAKRDAQRQVLADFSLRISEAAAAGNNVLAAELRVERAQKLLEFAEDDIQRTNAQAALNNAKTALARAIRIEEAKRRKRTKAKRGKAEVVPDSAVNSS